MSDHSRQPPLPAPERERFRRRQFVAPHRRRKLLFRLVRPFSAAVAIVGLPSVLVGWILLSDQFTVKEVEVASTGRVSVSWAEQRLETLEGRRLFGVGLRDVETVLAGHNWVRGVMLRRRPPNRLEVEILEKQPAALMALGANLVYLDSAGRVIGPYDSNIDPGDFVLMSAPEDHPELIANGLELLDSWRRKKLPFGDGLSEISALTSTDFRVITAGLPFPIFVSSLNLADGLASLVRYAPQLEKKLMRLSPIGAVDLRFHGRIVCQPAAPKPHNLEGERNA
ncbi:MAG: FtsQ-type POTRA domain-containing protein [bacterium]|nr:FtsQ-type POTRA domain-containing protein [bacterium]